MSTRRKPSPHLARATLLTCFALAAALLPAQEPAAPPQIRVQVNVVNVAVTVTDARGKFVTGLSQDRFRLLDNGAPQTISHFAPIEAPAQILLLVETSPAVILIHREHLTAMYTLLAGLAAEDRVALATYSDRFLPVTGFTADKSSIAAAMPRVRFGLGMANLNLLASLDAALTAIHPVTGRKAVVLLSTGLDPAPPEAWADFYEKLAATDAVIFPVALGADLRTPAGAKNKKKKNPKNSPGDESGETFPSMPTAEDAAKAFADADRRLTEMSKGTGGQAFFPRRPGDFPAIYRELAAQLRNQYSIGFTPPVRDGKLHTLEVQVLDAKGKPGYTVRARRSYLAPAP